MTPNTRRRLGVTALAALAALGGLGGGVLAPAHAVRAARQRLLAAETGAAAQAARRPDAHAALGRLLPGRWAQSTVVHAGLDEAEVAAVPGLLALGADGGLVGRAAVYDADSWYTVGTIVVLEDGATPRGVPRPVWASCALAGLVLVALTVVGLPRFEGKTRWVIIASALLAAAAPTLLATRWAHATLRQLTDRRIALAATQVDLEPSPAAVLARPGGVATLTGLKFLTRFPGGAVPLSTLPPEPTRALAEATPGPDRRIVADRVTYAVADRGPIRLVLPAFEQVLDPAPAAAALLVLGIGAWAIALSLGPLLAAPRRFRQEIVAWSFLAPGLLHLAVFTVGPLLFAAWLSLHRWSLVDEARPFVALENYRRVLGTGDFWRAIWNTTVYTLHVPVSIALALAFALLARQRGRAAALARTTMFLPCITSLAAVAMVWQWLLHEEYGLVNYALSWIGAAPVRWLTSPSTALLSVMLVSIWTTVGYQVVLLQAGLAAIPRDLYDAARIDGAGRWQQLWHVTLPGLRHTLFFVLITSIIGSFQVFGLVYVMTDGGPLHATDVAVFHIYAEAWDYLRFGSAAAMSWVLFAIVFAVTWLHFRTLERRTAE